MEENGEEEKLLSMVDFAISERQEGNEDGGISVREAECGISGPEEDCDEGLDCAVEGGCDRPMARQVIPWTQDGIADSAKHCWPHPARRAWSFYRAKTAGDCMKEKHNDESSRFC
jgi:hypothetical protein